MDNGISFRDRLYTIGEGGKRKWVYAAIPAGRYTLWRNIAGLLLLALFYAIPFIRVGGEPFLLLNVLERKFVIFGMIMWPQDTYLLGIATITFIVFIILFTVVYGRVWCGWACPQTVFMEIIFRRVETWIDGSPMQQKALKAQPMNLNKFFRRVFKFLVFLIIIFYSVNTFAALFMGMDALLQAYAAGLAGHPFLAAFTGIFTFAGMFIYWWFREQACTVICPYGRLQGVLLDNQTVLVAYDYRRGEPRRGDGQTQTGTGEPKGDCIDCHRCIAVCPTGIDVRNGTQLECINCTACMDACDKVMKKTGQPPGLIRLTSEESIRLGRPHRFSARAKAYSVLLITLLVFLFTLLTGRSAVEATILRTPGLLWQPYDSVKVSNLYNIRLVNKTRQDCQIRIEALNISGTIAMPGSDSLVVKARESVEAVFFFIIGRQQAETDKIEVKFRVFANGAPVQDFSTTFVGTKQKLK